MRREEERRKESHERRIEKNKIKKIRRRNENIIAVK